MSDESLIGVPVCIKESDNVLWFNKPSGWLITKHPWFQSLPDIRSWAIEKSEIASRSSFLGSAYHLDPEITGLSLLVKDSKLRRCYRNIYGSQEFQFFFRFLVKHPPASKKLICDLPLLHKESNNLVKVSHAGGKKTQTVFCEIEQLGNFGLWEARTTYLRLKQIRIHAMEVGLNIVNDIVYGDSKLLYLSDLKLKYQLKKSDRMEFPIYENLSIHLKKVEFRTPLNDIRVQECPFPKKWEVLYKQIRKYG